MLFELFVAKAMSKSIAVFLLLLTITSQAMAVTTSPCKMPTSTASNAMANMEMTSSAHTLHDTASFNSNNNPADCCDQNSNCSMSHCGAPAALPSFVDFSNNISSQQVSPIETPATCYRSNSLFRPPIFG